MRGFAGVSVKGASDVECQGSANPDDRLARNSESGPAAACTFDTVIFRGQSFRSQDRERASPPMTARASNPKPARSDGLDNVDGGPDAAFYIQMGVIEQVCIFCRF